MGSRGMPTGMARRAWRRTDAPKTDALQPFFFWFVFRRMDIVCFGLFTFRRMDLAFFGWYPSLGVALPQQKSAGTQRV